MSQLENLSTQSSQSIFSVKNALIFVSVIMVLYHLISTQTLLFDPIKHQNFHYMFALLVVFLAAWHEKKINGLTAISFIVITLFSTGYVHVLFSDLQIRQGSPTDLDVVVGVLLIVLALVSSWKSLGLALPILSIVFILYSLYANYVPSPLDGYPVDFDRLISSLSIGLTGIYGNLLGTSANFIFLFIVLGALFETTGTTRFFKDMGYLAGRFTKGGPAQTAIISSSLVGMSSGSAAANVGITGTFSIPMMKSAGYKPEEAAGIEASASSAGQILPPIMGASAFIMADTLGVSYLEIVKMAIIPSLFFLISMIVEVEFIARKRSLAQLNVKYDFVRKEFYLRMPLFIVPITILITMMMMGKSAMNAAFMAIVSLFIISLFRKETRPTWKGLMNGMMAGAKQGSAIAVATAVVAPIWVGLTATGLGMKLPAAIETLSGGYLLFGVFIVMVASILLGMGLPTLVAYLLVALTTAPALVSMGASIESAHFAAMYFAVFSAITPPFAIAALVASGIAQSNFMKSAMQAFNKGLIAFIMPFLFIYNPILIGQFTDPFSTIATLFAALMVIITLVIIKTGFVVKNISWVQRLIIFISFTGSVVYIVSANYLGLLASIIILLSVIFYQYLKNKNSFSNEASIN